MISPTETAIAAPALLFAIPEDERRFAANTIPPEVHEDILVMFEYCRAIHEAENKAAAIRALSERRRGQRGFSAPSLSRKYYRYVDSGDWRVLWDKARAPVASEGLPEAFQQFFKRLCEDNQRCCAGGWRELKVIWKTHFSSDGKTEYKQIPGYRDWPKADAATELPKGWTERNLYRYVPEDYHLALARKGRAGASQLRLKVYRTRLGLRIGEFIQFDDHEYNLKVNFPDLAQKKAMRPRGFTAIDVLTSFPIAKSFKPTLWDADEEKKIALTEKDMMWFTTHVLCDVGYRTDERGTAFVVEWGTAAIRQAFEDRIRAATSGHVRMERSGKFGTEGQGRLSVATQERGQVKGNFRFKALIESFWNIVDNYLAGLPGQVGKDRNHAPEQVYGLDKYNEKLLKLATVLPAEVAAKLVQPYYTWQEFLNAALTCYQAIETHTDHRCEGWLKCGFEAKEWRLNVESDWLHFSRLLALAPDEQRLAKSMILANPLLARARRFSRAEAFQSLRGELTKLPAFHWPVLLGEENAVREGEALAPASGVFEFTLPGFSGEPLRFVAEDNFGARLTDKYVLFVNPFNPTLLVACDARLRVKALCQPATVSCHNDRESLKSAMGAARSWEARAITEFEARHGDAIKARHEMHERNGELLSGSTLSADAARDRATIRDEKSAAAADEEIIRKYGSPDGNALLEALSNNQTTEEK